MRLLLGILLVLAAPLHASDAASVGGCSGTEPERIVDADPSTYLALLPTLGPGDLMRLAGGTYASGLPLSGLAGEPDRCILIEGPAAGLSGPAIDLSGLGVYEDWDRDFNGASRPGTFRGAYAGEGANPGWLPALERKPEFDPAIFADGFESGDTGSWSVTTSP